MSLAPVFTRIAAQPVFAELTDTLFQARASGPVSVAIRNASGSLPALALLHLHRHLKQPIMALLPDAEQATHLVSDLEQLDASETAILQFPSSGAKPYDPEMMRDPTFAIARTDALQQLAAGFDGIVVASIDAVCERVPARSAVQQETLTLAIGERMDPQSLLERLSQQRFKHVEFVEQAGEMALRGGILDVFPYTGPYPLRIEFFGDEIDSLREFDVHSQRSISRLRTARIVPNLSDAPAIEGPDAHTDVFSYLGPGTLFALFDERSLTEQAGALFQRATEAFQLHNNNGDTTAPPPPETLYLREKDLTGAYLPHTRMHFGSFAPARPADRSIDVDARPQPSFNGSINQLRKTLRAHHDAGMDTLILCDSRGQESRLHELLEEDIEQGRVRLQVDSLHQGFEFPAAQLAVYTDHQIFNRYHRPTTRRQRKKQGGLSIRELRNLKPGDFVVHIDYGIGKFAGLEHITVREKQQEAVRLLFRDEDVLYVNVNALYKLHKYTGKEGHQPALTKLGSGQWERAKSKTKKRVKDIARDLIALYARRKASQGHAFPKDTLWQRELEASFQYEDTPDQGLAAETVKQDMELPIPMDRLVCGDVGFGKTEIAVRAAFKAVQDGRQVAVLVPTTILASQHFETFSKRLKAYPVRVAELSRFRSASEIKTALDAVKSGQIDIVIGTHRLLSKDVAFKKLGLLIIDEEQRFGVAAKERLRNLRAEVDTLALTATPIPRTLQFSLMGARDLSIISTPPPNRQPIVTEIHTFDKDLIRDAILYETNRGGQVFFIHNRVQSIDDIADMLRLLIPNIRIQVGHGQMKPADLERVMDDFIEHKFDVLVSTNIVESGLDISNANTIIINHADHFGLSDIHQLRGRVGRSDQKAFCYLLVPSIHTLTRDAKQRLQAVEEFSELGSGFNIAMRDLDIRGAGNMLGAEQSGFIADVGYETYHRILDEAVHELRSEEFSELFTDVAPPAPSDTVIDVEEDAFIPETYLSSSVERLNLYRRLSEAETTEALAELRAEMEDRFGEPPAPVSHLITATALRNLGQSLRLPKITFKNQRLFLEVPGDKDDAYFYEHLFQPLLGRLNALGNRFVLKESAKGKLRIIIQDVPSLDACMPLMRALEK
ncbi:MAG: transcription-repair coupling factor [Rhodothermales bacterium]